MWTRPIVGLLCVWSLFSLALPPVGAAEPQRPNFLIIFTDDQGYGDLSCYGSPTIRTPRIDRLAREGTRFTSFYAQIVCGPSRSALLTGRYPVRSRGWSMPASEITFARLLKQAGYVTGCIGKWDVSNRAAILDRMPLAHGFDYYYGTLGANDGGFVVLHEGNERVAETHDMAGLTRRYTDKAIEFLRRNKDRPFMLYVAHTMVHSIIDASPEFRGKSKGGLYGDTVEELDFHTGRLLDAVDELGLRDNTLVIFTTDNGPWNNFQEFLSKRHNGEVAWGSSGPLREGKGSTYEGGLRVPCIVRWPGKVPAGATNDALFATIDFLPTFCSLAGARVPQDRIIDGVDQTQLLLGKNASGARSDYFYFCKGEMHAVRKGRYKLILPDRKQFYGYVDDKGSQRAELYDLEADIGEKHDLAAQRPELVKELLDYARKFPVPKGPYDPRIQLNQRRRRGKANRLKLVQGDWKEHGLSQEHRQKIRQVFQAGIERKLFPGGALMLVHRGEIVFREGFGVADIASKRPFDPGAPCLIASVTKPHTATLLVKLAAEGVVDLDVPIDRYLPEFRGVRVQGGKPAKQAPTLKQCLSHTAGFPGNTALKRGMFGDSVMRASNLAEAVGKLAKEELLAEPGTRSAYSRLGYLVAARVAEVATGWSFADLMERQLFRPLGMQTATFTPSERVMERMPTLYRRDADGFQPRRGERAMRAINPGGGLVSTLDDVARLMLLHAKGGKVAGEPFIPSEFLEMMYQRQPNTPGSGYGLGFNLTAGEQAGKVARIQHGGATGTYAAVDFRRDLIIVYFTQVPPRRPNRWRDQLLETIESAFPVARE